MPAWAEDDPGKYWQAADEHERTNGRLFQQVEVALPVELDERQRRDLARSFAEKLTGPERLPYTLAIHRGEAKNPRRQEQPPRAPDALGARPGRPRPPDFLGYEVAACPSLSLCAHLLDFLRLHCLHSI